MHRLILRGAMLAEAGGLLRADVAIDNERITAIDDGMQDTAAEVVDVAGLVLGPGLVDVHVHGGGGHAFFTRDADRIAQYCDWAPRNGVTSFLISTIGRNAEDTEAILNALQPMIGRPGGAEPLGFHLEGPFINPIRKGAFDPRMLHEPSAEAFNRYQAAAGGHIRQVTLAPELANALPLIRAAAASGAIPAMGHTDGVVGEVVAGFEAGIRHVTHLFNAMRPIHQREGGPAVHAMLEPSVTCELICDGAHVAPELLRLAYKAIGPARVVIVTDNLHLAGTGGMTGSFGGAAVSVEGAKAVREDGTIVGSVATMDQHFRNAMEFLGVDISIAFRLCSTNPAAIANAAARKGRLAPGFDADIVGFDAQGRVRLTLCRGAVVFDSREQAGG